MSPRCENRFSASNLANQIEADFGDFEVYFRANFKILAGVGDTVVLGIQGDINNFKCVEYRAGDTVIVSITDRSDDTR